MRTAFKAYDIRGIYNKDFNASDVYKIGFFLPGLLGADKILIGMDARVSSKEIFWHLSRGITDAGADVHYCGLSTTPMIYWATAKFGYEGSVMITASHNPASYNGLKISRKDALPVGYDSGLKELLHKAETLEIKPADHKGEITDFSFKQEYLEFLQPYKTDLSRLKMAIDCSNGMSSLLVKELFGNSPVYIFDEIDGTFPNHEPNPLEAKNIVDLSKTVLENKCDIGVIFDGDADRVMFVDEKGKFIQPDMMIAVVGKYFSSLGMTGKCLQDIRTSKSVTESIESMGFEMHTWRVGRAYAALKLREINGLFGGELAGHYYFRDFYYSDSAYLAALIILGEIKKAHDRGITVSEMISQISVYHGSGELNFHIEDKDAAMKELINIMQSDEKPVKVMDFDGYRIEFEQWWFNIRPSNTEPYLRLLIEAKTPELLEQKTTLAKSVLQQFIL
jgi:phosphomannomutase